MKYNKVYYFNSNERYLLDQRYNKFIEDFKLENGDLNISTCSAKTFVDEVLTYPFIMFGDKRLVIFDLDDNKKIDSDISESIVEALLNLPDSTVLVIKGAIDKRTTIYKTLTKLNNKIKLTPKKTNELESWINEEYKDLNLKKDQISLILKTIGVSDKEIIKYEISKLKSFDNETILNTLNNRQIIQDIPSLKESELVDWVLKQDMFSSLKLNKVSCKKILDRTGYSNMYYIINEITKLVDLEKPLTNELLEFMIKKTIDVKVYELTNALSKKDKAHSYRIINELEIENNYMGALSMLNKNISVIKLIQDNESKSNIQDNLGIKDYTYNMLNNAAKIYSKEEVNNLILMIRDIDFKMKNGENHKILMEQLVANF